MRVGVPGGSAEETALGPVAHRREGHLLGSPPHLAPRQGLAVGFGAQSLVKDVINPLIGAAVGGVDFSNVFVALNGQHYPTLDAAQKAGAPTVNIGLFINALINFLIIAFVVFWIGKAAARLMRREAEAPSAPPAPTRSEVLLEEIRDLLASRTPDTPSNASSR